MNKIKKFLHKINLKYVHDISINCFYIKISRRDDIIKYCIDQLIQILKKEYYVDVFFKPKEFFINKYGEDHPRIAGCYYFLKKSYSENIKITNDYFIKYGFDENFRYPRIVIDNEYEHDYQMLFLCLIHEIGNMMIHYNNENNDEANADFEGAKFVINNIDPVFQGIFSTILKEYNKDFKLDNFKEHYVKYYIPFIEKNKELKLDYYRKN